MANFTKYELKEFDTSTLTPVYQDLGTPTLNAVRSMNMFNTSTVDAYISIDGVANAIRLPAKCELYVYGDETDFSKKEVSFVLRKGAQLKVKQVSGAAAGAIIVHLFE